MEAQADQQEVESIFKIYSGMQQLIWKIIGHEKVGVTKSQFYILMALTRWQYLSMGQLAGAIATSKEQATRAVTPLVEEEYVERFIGQENRRHVFVKLTPKGMEFIRGIQQQMMDALVPRFQMLTDEEKRDWKESIGKILVILQKIDAIEDELV